MAYSATITLTGGTTNANVDNFSIYAIGSDGSTVRATLATGVSRASLSAGYGVSGIEATDSFIRVTSNSTCVNSVDYALPGATPTPTPSPVVSMCYTLTSGVYPVSGGSGTSAQGTITVAGASVNVWTKYNSGGQSSGTASFSGTFNSISASGTFTILTGGQTGYSSTGGTSSGYVTLSPGTYSFTITKSDNNTSGAQVTMVWSTGTNPNTASNTSTC